METTHTIEIGSKVRVRFEAGWIGERFYRSGWRVGTVAAHTSTGAGPSYDVTLLDGATVAWCHPSCVRVRP